MDRKHRSELDIDKKIDRHNLERENELQPSLTEKWGRRLVDARCECDDLEKKLERLKSSKEKEKALAESEFNAVEGDLLIKVKNNPSKYVEEGEKVPKVTSDSSAKGIVCKQESYKKALKKYLEAKDYLNHEDYKEMVNGIIEAKRVKRLLEVAENAVNQKSFSLRNMTDLYQSGYFSIMKTEPGIDRHQEEQESRLRRRRTDVKKNEQI